MNFQLENLRVFWLEDGQCILFNSSRQRVSGVYSAAIGKTVEAVCRGMDFDAAARETGASLKDCLAVTCALSHFGGGEPVTPPLPADRKCFYRTLVLAPSARCNMRCVYCSGDAGERSDAVMDWDMAKAAIDYFYAHCDETAPMVLQFHGAGEPMTAPDIVRKATEYAREIAEQKNKLFFSRISTNGVMTREQALWLAQNMNHISLSIDGLPEVHNAQRPLKNGEGSYDTALGSLSVFKEYHAVKRINMVVSNQGLAHMEENLRHIHSLCGQIELRVLPMQYCGRSARTNQTPVDRAYFNRKLPELIQAGRELGVRVVTGTELMAYSTDHYCQACGYAMCVTPSGDVSTCVEAMFREEKGLSELFIGTYDKEARTFSIDWEKVFRLRGRTYAALEGCRNCVFKTNCAGNCLVRAARENGTVFSVSKQACDMTKKALAAELIKQASQPSQS